MPKTPLYLRRRTCRFCRKPLGSPQALAAKMRARPAEALAAGRRRAADELLEVSYAYAFGVLEEWARHTAAKVEGYCDEFCRGADQKPEQVRAAGGAA